MNDLSFSYFIGAGIGSAAREELSSGLEERTGLHQDPSTTQTQGDISDQAISQVNPWGSPIIEFGNKPDPLRAWADIPMETNDASRGFTRNDVDGVEEQHWEAGQAETTARSIQTLMRDFNDGRTEQALHDQRIFDDIASFEENVARDMSHAYRRINWLNMSYAKEIHALTDTNL